MNPRLTAVAAIYRANTQIFHMTLADVSDAQTRSRPVATGGSLLWIAGHAAHSRAEAASLAGAPLKPPFGGAFQRGQRPDNAALPPLAEVVTFWDTVSARLLDACARLDDAALDAPVSGRFPVELPGVWGALTFLALHDSYHLGQMGHLRRTLGHPGIAG